MDSCYQWVVGEGAVIFFPFSIFLCCLTFQTMCTYKFYFSKINRHYPGSGLMNLKNTLLYINRYIKLI